MYLGIGLCEPAEDFLRSIGLFEAYEPDVSRDESGEEALEDSSESYSEDSDGSDFSMSCSRLLVWIGRRGFEGVVRFVTRRESRPRKPAIPVAVRGMLSRRRLLLRLETSNGCKY